MQNLNTIFECHATFKKIVMVALRKHYKVMLDLYARFKTKKCVITFILLVMNFPT